MSALLYILFYFVYIRVCCNFENISYRAHLKKIGGNVIKTL